MGHHGLLTLKLTVAPLLVAGVTLAARRWGPRVSGLLVTLPVVSGPALIFYAFEQGPRFAADAAKATLLGMVAVEASAVVYAFACVRWPWWGSVIASWIAFAVAMLAIVRTSANLGLSLAAMIAGSLLAQQVIPRALSTADDLGAPWWDVPIRMVAAATLVYLLTTFADRLGPRLAGVLTPFPIAMTIVAAFTHAQRGRVAALHFFRGFFPGMIGFGLFCFVMSASLERWPVLAAVAAALAAQAIFQSILLIAAAAGKPGAA